MKKNSGITSILLVLISPLLLTACLEKIDNPFEDRKSSKTTDQNFTHTTTRELNDKGEESTAPQVFVSSSENIIRGSTVTRVLPVTVLHLPDYDAVEFATPELVTITEPEATLGEQSLAINPLLNDFAHQMFKQHIETNGLFNFVITPANTLTMAGMLLSASAGESTPSIEKSLGWLDLGYAPLLDLNIADNNQINFSSATWGQIDYDFSDEFLSVLNNRQTTENNLVDYLNLGSNPTIELLSWLPTKFSDAASPTASKLNDINSNTRFVYGNQLTVSADLLSSYPDLQLVDGMWQDASEYQETIPMLKIQGRFLTYNTAQFKSVKLPLSSGEVSLTVIMPVAGSENFDVVEKNLKTILADFTDNASQEDIELMLPTFSIEARRNLKGIISNGKYFTGSDSKFSSPGYTAVSFDANYSVGNNAEKLERDILFSRSSIVLDNSALTSQAVGFTSLNAIKNQNPLFVITRPNTGVGFTQISVTDPSRQITTLTFISTTGAAGVELCKKVENKAGANQATPFLFILHDDVTGNILQMGRVTMLEGNKAEKSVCVSEKVDYPDEIWPLQSSLAESEQVDAGEYIADTFNGVNLYTNDVVDLLNKQMTQSFIDANTNENYLSASLSEIVVSTMQKITGPVDLTNAWLSPFTENVSAVELQAMLSSLTGSNPLNLSLTNSLWAQSDYLINKNYLDSISNSFKLNIETADFFTNPDQQKIELSNILSSTIVNDFAVEKLIGNRTRLLFASIFTDEINIQGNPTTSTFLNDNNIIPVASIQFDGSYQYYENLLLKAFELGSHDGLQMLIIMPTPDSFNNVKYALYQHIKNIDENLSLQQISFSIPMFNITNNQHETPTDSLTPSYVSKYLPVLPMPQFSRNQVQFNSDGVYQEGYSFSALVAPADLGGIGSYPSNYVPSVFSFDLYDLSEMPSFMLPAPCTSIPTTYDNSAFIFVIRDSYTHVIHQLGQVLNLYKKFGEC